jgi:RNA polymerase-binding transcription factor DksA
MDAATARDRLEQERLRLTRLREEQRGDGFGLSAGDTTAGGGLNDKLGGDAATQAHDREVEQAIGGHLEAELAEVDAALRRVDDGTYGRCEVGGEHIPDERLELLPATRYCAAHAAEVERSRGTEARGTQGLSSELERQRRGPA